MSETTYYKVLGANGRSCHGGNLQWSLPTQGDDGTWTPGEWHEVTGAISVCNNGLHVMREPARWWVADGQVFAVEYDGDTDSDGGDKIAVRRCRLLRKLSNDELGGVGIFLAGDHKISDGYARAYGSATVRAFGNAKVRASGSATVVASDSATVEAYGSATVRAYGSATVEAYGSATVEASHEATVRAYDSATVVASGSAKVEAFGNAKVRASGSATVEAYGSATVEAYGSAKVRASDEATVRAYDSATVLLWTGKPTIELTSEMAVLIDRRSDKPVVTVGGLA